jgi:hypothetical protein
MTISQLNWQQAKIQNHGYAPVCNIRQGKATQRSIRLKLDSGQAYNHSSD